MGIRSARWALTLAMAVLAAACGGGSGPALLAQAARQQEEERPTFNLAAAYNFSITDAAVLDFDVEGMANGVPFEGSGSYEQGMLQTVAEFDANGGALRKSMPLKMTIHVNGQEVKVENVTHEFYARSGMRLLGRQGPAPHNEFTEVTQYAGLPAEAQVGANGVFYTAKRYTDSSRRSVIGVTQATYTLEPDRHTDTSLLVIRTADNRADGSPGSVTTTTYRITRAGTAKLVSLSTADAATQSTLKATFL